MHELGITEQIVCVVTKKACGEKVTRVVLEIGMLSGVLPDAVRFCFDLCTEGTVAAGAKLEILEIPGLASCKRCGENVVLKVPFGRCECGNTELEWVSGEELRVKEMEVV